MAVVVLVVVDAGGADAVVVGEVEDGAVEVVLWLLQPMTVIAHNSNITSGISNLFNLFLLLLYIVSTYYTIYPIHCFRVNG